MSGPVSRACGTLVLWALMHMFVTSICAGRQVGMFSDGTGWDTICMTFF